MRTAIAVVAVLMAAGFSGCAMNNCGNGCGQGLLGGMARGCNTGCDSGCGCSTGCDTGCQETGCDDKCGNGCGCGKRGLYPGPLASMRMQRAACDPCNTCESPRVGMGEMALFARAGMRRGSCCDSCGSKEQDCGCESGGKIRERMMVAKARMGEMRGRMTGGNCNSCGSTEGNCGCQSGGLLGGSIGSGSLGGFLRSTEPRMNRAGCSSCGQDCGGNCGGGGLLNGVFAGGGNGQAVRGGGRLASRGGMRATCGPGCRGCGGRGCLLGGGLGGLRGDPRAEHPYGGQIPHTDGFGGPHGPISPTYAYPYYTTRGPRDFFMDNPPTIGR